MATVDEVVRDSIIRYPMLNDNRTDVLHNVLCVIGTGYEWNDKGEIDIPVFDDDSPKWTPKQHRKDRKKTLNSLPTHVAESVNTKEDRARFEQEIKKLSEVIATVDERVHLRVETEIKDYPASSAYVNIYPQDKYAPLMNVPDNVTDDWREAVEEMRQYASKRGWKF